MANIDHTAALLRTLFHYDPDTGVFTRKVKTSSRAKLGVPVGNPSGQGHLQIRFDGTRHLAHRLAWLYVHGEWPSKLIDHINGNPTDNRIANLRDVSASINAQNQRSATKKNKRSKLIGAHFHVQSGKFLAHIRLDGVTRHLGSFDTEQEAHEVYIAEKRRVHAGCTI